MRGCRAQGPRHLAACCGCSRQTSSTPATNWHQTCLEDVGPNSTETEMSAGNVADRERKAKSRSGNTGSGGKSGGTKVVTRVPKAANRGPRAVNKVTRARGAKRSGARDGSAGFNRGMSFSVLGAADDMKPLF